MNAERKIPFFTIVIPAHNEEQYLPETLTRLAALEYPAERFEVIVVENGSTDATREKATPFENAQVRVLSFPQKGVSFARNRGIDAASPACDWLVMLDADTHLAPSFLHEAATRVMQDVKGELVVGAVNVGPIPRTVLGILWFYFYDGMHYLLRQTCMVTLARRSMVADLRYDENLNWMEDIRFGQALKKRGKYFFLTTSSVATSTRRFSKDGWLRALFVQMLAGMLPVSLQRRLGYAAVR